jgi:hypothetical protein
MITAIAVIISALAALTLILVTLLVVVTLGIRREPADVELKPRAPGLTSHAVRRLLGVYVRRPDQSGQQRQACLTGPQRSKR